ncbi:Rhamnan synthesis protein F [Planctomycetales bacterium 10988]|nr:Rhamnan synthesis protein F [Planctomycetales bacterium 10988]
MEGLRNWGFDFEYAKEILAKLNISLSADNQLEFPTGAMFWAKVDALSPLFDLKLTYEDFPPEEGQIDGTIAHAIERSFLHIAEDLGYQHVKVRSVEAKPIKQCLSTTFNDVSYLKQRHETGLLYSASKPSAFNSSVGEIFPVNVARSVKQGTRLNIIIPTMKPEKIYGGISSAIHSAKCLAEAMNVQSIRLLVTSDEVDTPSMQQVAKRLNTSFLLAEPNDDTDGNIVVDLFSRRNLPVVLREDDVFFATAWWTADLAFRLKDVQEKLFGHSLHVVYLIQDFEPGFYPWSNQYALAEATYLRGDETIALINSEELANFFAHRYHFAHTWYLPFVLNKGIQSSLRPTVKKKKIIVYGRPSVQRNLFSLIVEGLRIWQDRDPRTHSEYEILMAGEAFQPELLSDLENAKVCGKLSLEEYGSLLNEAAIGISLMLSPHPSYPPLEMATAGCFTISNAYEAKDLTKRASSIYSLNSLKAESIADALDIALNSIQHETPAPLVPLNDIDTKFDKIEYAAVARVLTSSSLKKGLFFLAFIKRGGECGFGGGAIAGQVNASLRSLRSRASCCHGQPIRAGPKAKSSFRMFAAAPAKTALIASPAKPLRKQRPRRWSDLRWPIFGSIALRRRRRFFWVRLRPRVLLPAK